ncbi:hypothetical protein EDD85DRAFT_814328 [Armillaria nabsnona]|nr:hypothetical protein EDD85DRAFT_814328 [Armillaria nabsnona]
MENVQNPSKKREASLTVTDPPSPKHAKTDPASSVAVQESAHSLNIRKLLTEEYETISDIRDRLKNSQIPSEEVLNEVGLVLRCTAQEYKSSHPDWPYNPIAKLSLLRHPRFSISEIYDHVAAVSSEDGPKWEDLIYKYGVEESGSQEEDDHTMSNNIQDYLSSCHDVICQVILGQKDFSLWKGVGQDGSDNNSFFKKLRLPQVAGWPSLLLHELGNYDADAFDELLEPLFVHGRCLMLVNTTGSGKTRFFLEGLVRHWGVYFVGNRDTTPLGSRDFQFIIERIQAANAFKADAVSKEDFKVNEDVARQQYKKLLLSRMIVFDYFLHASILVASTVSEKDLRLAWVKIQVHPSDIIGQDIFVDVVQRLDRATDGYLGRELQERLNSIRNLLHNQFPPQNPESGTRTFSCIIDEVRGPILQALTAFRSGSSPNMRRSLMRPLMQDCRDILADKNWFLSLSGTGTNIRVMAEHLASSLLKPGADFYRHSEIGAFENADIQARYIKKFAPPGLHNKLSDFLGRVFVWTRGRFRLTATLVELLIVTGFKCPHTVLNRYIKVLCGDDFEPGDANDFIGLEPPLPDSGIWKILNVLDVLDVGRLAKLKQFEDVLKPNLADYVLTGKPLPVLSAKDSMLVELGVSRFTGSSEDVKTDEPLILTAIMAWLERTEKDYLHKHIMKGAFTTSPDHNPSEGFCSYALMQALGGGRTLSDVLDFYFPKSTPIPEWIFQKARVVTPCYYDHIKKIYQTAPYSFQSRNYPQVGFYVESATQFQQWLNFKGPPHAFCYPIPRAGPDLACLVELENGEKVWFLGQTKVQRGVWMITKEDLVHAARSVIPANVYINAERTPSYGPPQANQQFLTTLDTLENNVDKFLPSTSAAHHAIGVLFIYPALHEIRRLEVSRWSATTTPIAAVNWDKVGPILDNMLPQGYWTQLVKNSAALLSETLRQRAEDAEIDYDSTFLILQKDVITEETWTVPMMKIQLELHRRIENLLPPEQRKLPTLAGKNKEALLAVLKEAIDRYVQRTARRS